MAVVRALDIVEACYSYEDGMAVYDVLHPQLLAGNNVTLSFDGVSGVTSAFVNAALIDLLDSVDFKVIKKHLSITNVNTQIADVVLSRFRFEVNERV